MVLCKAPGAGFADPDVSTATSDLFMPLGFEHGRAWLPLI
jgi:hypothetical protein